MKEPTQKYQTRDMADAYDKYMSKSYKPRPVANKQLRRVPVHPLAKISCKMDK